MARLLSKNCWNCFGECSGGNILDFVSQMEECSIREAAVKITDWFSIECTSNKKRTPRKSAKKASRKSVDSSQTKRKEKSSVKKEADKFVNEPLGFKLELDCQHSSLDDLCLSDETVEEFGLGYCSKGYLKGCIAFPIHNVNGEVVAYGGIIVDNENPNESDYRYPTKDKFDPSLELFGLHYALQRGSTDAVYWVRNPLDIFQAWHNDGISAVCVLGEFTSESLGLNLKKMIHGCLE